MLISYSICLVRNNGFPMFSDGFPMVFRWFSDGFQIVFPDCSPDGFPDGFPACCRIDELWDRRLKLMEERKTYVKILCKLEKQYPILVLSLNIFQMEKLEICCCAKD